MPRSAPVSRRRTGPMRSRPGEASWPSLPAGDFATGRASCGRRRRESRRASWRTRRARLPGRRTESSHLRAGTSWASAGRRSRSPRCRRSPGPRTAGAWRRARPRHRAGRSGPSIRSRGRRRRSRSPPLISLSLPMARSLLSGPRRPRVETGRSSSTAGQLPPQPRLRSRRTAGSWRCSPRRSSPARRPAISTGCPDRAACRASPRRG